MNDIDRIKEMVYQAVFAILDDEESVSTPEIVRICEACEWAVQSHLGGRTPSTEPKLKEMDKLTELMGMDDDS